MANDVLLTVSGIVDADIESQIERGERPLADYIALARTFNADILDYTEARRRMGRSGRLLERMTGPSLLLAWACFRQRHRYRAIFTDGEQIGIPLALLFKLSRQAGRPAHLMIGHLLSARKKHVFFDRLHLQDQIDTFFVYATQQKQFIQRRWQIAPDRVVYTPFMVDADFFAPGRGRDNGRFPSLPLSGQKPIICAVGLEFRDYPTLLQAVRGLDVQVVIAAASPWSKRADTTAAQAVFEGVTTLLEAMAMAKAVICSRTRGQTDVVIEQETGLYVPPEDPAALREAITHLLAHPRLAQQLGLAGRNRIEQEMSLDRYVTRLNHHVRQAQRKPC